MKINAALLTTSLLIGPQCGTKGFVPKTSTGRPKTDPTLAFPHQGPRVRDLSHANLALTPVDNLPEFSRLERLTLPVFDSTMCQLRQASVKKTIKQHPSMTMDSLTSLDLLTTLHGTRAACSLSTKEIQRFNIPIEGRPGIVPAAFLIIDGDEFYGINEKISFIYNKNKVSDLLKATGLYETININALCPFTEQFEKELPTVLGSYEKEFFLGLCHGIDPTNASICAALSGWGQGHIVVTPQISKSLGIPYLEPGRIGEAFEFSKENRGYVVPFNKYFDIDDFDEPIIQDNITNHATVNALKDALEVAKYMHQLTVPAPRGIDQSFGRRAFDLAAADRTWPAWEHAAQTLKSISGSSLESN